MVKTNLIVQKVCFGKAETPFFLNIVVKKAVPYYETKFLIFGSIFIVDGMQ